MKVPPKRKGNSKTAGPIVDSPIPLNESPSEKEGKYQAEDHDQPNVITLNESPSEKEGKCQEKPDLEVYIGYPQ